MEFCKFWAHSKPIPANGHKLKSVVGVGFSNQSVEDALRVANQRAEQMAHCINTGQPLDYDYQNLPMREEVIDRFTDDGKTIAVISRVHYGALVLNTTNVLFADIDLPQKQNAGFFSFFKKTSKQPGEETIEKIRLLCGRDSRLGLRLYRTAAGFRCLATSRRFEVTSHETTDLLETLNSDELYVTLCKRQDCFRARLSPKPHRIGMPYPPGRFPYETPADLDAAEKWIKKYEQKSEKYAACAFVAQMGNPVIAPEVAPVAKLHDHFSCAEKLPLA